MEEKIKDIRNAIKNRCFLSALALSVTLPDICGKIRSPGNASKKGYIDWFDEFVLPYYIHESDKYSDAYRGTEFDGKACYALRCAFLHSGNTSLKEQDPRIRITQFDLCLSSIEDNGIYVDMHGVITSDVCNEKNYRVRLDLRRLCKTLCDAAEKFYSAFEDKDIFKEHNIHIINIEEEIHKLDPNYRRTYF